MTETLRLARYLQKHGLYPAFVDDAPAPDFGLAVVIPVCNEPDIVSVLDSLRQCAPPACAVEVLLVINHADGAPAHVVAQNRKTLDGAAHWAGLHSDARFRVHPLIVENLPHKKAGAGLARKIGMDEAVRRFALAGNTDGVIACLDADCRVSGNYFIALEAHFSRSDAGACAIYFEHDLDACETAAHRLAIARYELHLRLYVNGLRQAGYPHAFHTIGSSMAVTALACARHGGMNQRRAGEDFYFLSKYMLTGEMSETARATVYPSPRLSDRVPFGTGVKTRQWMEQPQLAATYPPACYDAVRVMVESAGNLWRATPDDINALLDRLHPAARDYLLSQGMLDRLVEIRANSANPAAFRKRFFRWVNPFRIMQLVRRVSASLPAMPVETAAAMMADRREANADAEFWLAAYRRADRAASATDA